MIDNKEEYRKLCKSHPEIPLFMQSWWMDAACGENGWISFVAKGKGGLCEGVMVLHLKEKYGFKMVCQPILTQYNGVWLFYGENMNMHQRYELENRVMSYFADCILSLHVDFYQQNFNKEIRNWQPFYWKGFKQTTRYTFVIPNISDWNRIYEGFCSEYKRKLERADKKFRLGTGFSALEYCAFQKSCLKYRKREPLYSDEIFLSIFKAAESRGQAAILGIDRGDGAMCAMLCLVWDKNSAYNLALSVNTLDRDSWTIRVKIIADAIKFVSDKTQNYDFEGSMINGVAQRNQGFGAEQIPYSSVSKITNPLLKLWYWAKH